MVVVGAGTPVTRRGEGESDGGVGQRGGEMSRGSGTEGYSRTELKTGNTAVVN